MPNKTLTKIGKILGILAGVFLIIGGINVILGDTFLIFGLPSGYVYSPISGYTESLHRIILGILMIVIGILFILISAEKAGKMSDMTIGIVLLILSILFSNLLGLLASILIIVGELVK